MSLTCVPCKLLTAESLVDHLARVHPDQTFTIDVDPASDSAVIHAPGVPMTVEWPKPSRRRLTAAEWDAELARAKGVQAADVERHIERPPTDWRDEAKVHLQRINSEWEAVASMRTRTGRRRSWWQRGWKR